MDLFDFLDNTNSEILKQRIYKLGFNSRQTPTRKGERVEFLLSYLLNTGNLKKIIKQLNTDELAMVSEVVHSHNGVVMEEALRARLGSLPAGYLQDKPRYGRKRLGEKSPERVNSMIGTLLFGQKIPDDLCSKLATLLPEPEADRAVTTADHLIDEMLSASPTKTLHNGLPLYQYHGEAAAQHELYAALRLIELGKVTVSEKTLSPTAATTRKMGAELYCGDFFSEKDEELDNVYKDKLSPIRGYSWIQLIQQSGYSRRSNGKILLSSRGKALFQRNTSFADGIKQVYQEWCQQNKVDEFARINRIKGQQRKGRHNNPMLTPPASRRMALNTLLRETPGGEWIQIDEWLRFIRASRNPPVVSDNPWALYLVDAHYGNIDRDFKAIEGRYIMVYLFEVLATLGMVDLIYSAPHGVRDDFYSNWGADEYHYLSRYDGIGWFRINPLGRYCLELEDEYHQQEVNLPPLLQYQGALRYRLLRSAEPHEQLLLEQFTRQSKDHLQLDIHRGLEAIDQGYSLEEFTTLLQQQGDGPLDDEVEDLIDSLKMRSHAIEDGGPARIINCNSEHLARLLATSPETKKFCLFSNGKQLVVPERSIRKLIKGTRQLGYLIPLKGTA